MGRWAANGTNVDYNVDVADINSSGMVPTQTQETLTPQEKVATAVSVGAGSTLTIATVPMSGFNTIGGAVLGSASHAFTMNILATPDGNAVILDALVSKTQTGWSKSFVATSALEFVHIQIINNDAGAKTYDAWIRRMNL